MTPYLNGSFGAHYDKHLGTNKFETNYWYHCYINLGFVNAYKLMLRYRIN